MSISNYFWAPEQINIIREAYKPGGGGLKEASEKITDRPKAAIATKACRLKITAPKPRKSKVDS
jgi:hypothetical protein